jgi:hypothetical protein
MRPARALYPLAGLLFAAAALSPLFAQLAAPAGSSVSTVTPGASSPASPGGMVTTSSRLPTRTLRQILPDPALLDGTKLAPDKYPEYGMIGDFEMPGDDVTDPAQNQRVGASNPNQTQPAAGGSAAKIDPNQKSGGGSASEAKPEQPGGGGAADSKSAGTGGAADQAKSDKSGGGSSGNSGGSGGSNTANTKAGGKSPGRNDPNAKAEGIQVGSLNTDESTANSPQIDPTGVPIEIGIGDTANAIKPVAAAAGVTGKESAGTTQQAGKNTAPGGAQSGAGGSSGNRGSERGKTMPSGL